MIRQKLAPVADLSITGATCTTVTRPDPFVSVRGVITLFAVFGEIETGDSTSSVGRRPTTARTRKAMMDCADDGQHNGQYHRLELRSR